MSAPGHGHHDGDGEPAERGQVERRPGEGRPEAPAGMLSVPAEHVGLLRKGTYEEL